MTTTRRGLFGTLLVLAGGVATWVGMTPAGFAKAAQELNEKELMSTDDASKWAAEFRKMAIKLGYSDMDEGWLIAWFANAIECSHDLRMGRLRTKSLSILMHQSTLRVESIM